MGYPMKNEDIFFKNLSDLIILHRKKSGLNQQKLAKLAGIGKTSVFDLEHEKKTVQINTLLKVLNVLNISIELSSPLTKTIIIKDQPK